MNIIERACRLRQIIEQAIASVDDKTASEAVELASSMKFDNSLIKAGTRINWNGALKRATVDLWDNEQYSPVTTPELWEDVLYKDGIRVIPDVITSGAAFSLGESGWWKDELYESLIDNNVYTPEQYSAGWKVRSEQLGAN